MNDVSNGPQRDDSEPVIVKRADESVFNLTQICEKMKRVGIEGLSYEGCEKFDKASLLDLIASYIF